MRHQSSRKDVIAGMAGANKGESYWLPKVSRVSAAHFHLLSLTHTLSQLHYVKAHAYRVKPLKKKGHLAVDGEIYPFKEFQVEVHQCLGTLLSPYGHYAVDFTPHPPVNNNNSKRPKPSGVKKKDGARSAATI